VNKNRGGREKRWRKEEKGKTASEKGREGQGSEFKSWREGVKRGKVERRRVAASRWVVISAFLQSNIPTPT
jgi:hypothetical protein